MQYLKSIMLSNVYVSPSTEPLAVGADNSLKLVRRQAIIWNKGDL